MGVGVDITEGVVDCVIVGVEVGFRVEVGAGVGFRVEVGAGVGDGEGLGLGDELGLTSVVLTK